MRIIIYIFLLIISVNQITYGSELESQFIHFDSLLLDGNFDQLKDELDKSNKTVPTYEDSVKQHNRFNKYYRAIEFKKYFNKRSDLYLKNFVESKKSEHKYFSKNFAGEKAYESFEKFLKKSDNVNLLDAAKYYFIADYFRSNVIAVAIIRTKDIYQYALKKYNESNYKETYELLIENQIDPGNNYTLKSYQDSLDVLYKSAFMKHRAALNKKLYWDSKKRVQKKWFFSTGLNLTFQSAHENIVFDFSNQNPSVIYTDGVIKSQNNVGFSFEVLHNLSDRFFVGVDFMKSKFRYNSDFDLRLIQYDYTYDIYTTHLKTGYFLRKYAGLRPYVAVGFGYFKADRSESEVKVSADSTGGSNGVYILPQKTITSMQSLFEFGVQFITNEKSNIFFNLSSTFYKNFEEDSAIKSSYKSIAVHFGLIF